MAKYVYPALFTKSKDKSYEVDFPDLEGCYTCGFDLVEAMDYASDALALTLYDYERDEREIPVPSEIDDIKHAKNAFVTYIACDTTVYRKRNNRRAVKKTLSIPEWLNEKAVDAGINFSQVLQEALKEKLQIS